MTILYPLWAMAEMPECDRCGRCCGPVPVSQDELVDIREYCQRKGVRWIDRGLLVCGFLSQENRCRIYEVRPLLCRLYGVITGLRCPVFPAAAQMRVDHDEVLCLTGEDAVMLETVAI